jgi:hypothetical protein
MSFYPTLQMRAQGCIECKWHVQIHSAWKGRNQGSNQVFLALHLLFGWFRASFCVIAERHTLEQDLMVSGRPAALWETHMTSSLFYRATEKVCRHVWPWLIDVEITDKEVSPCLLITSENTRRVITNRSWTCSPGGWRNTSLPPSTTCWYCPTRSCSYLGCLSLYSWSITPGSWPLCAASPCYFSCGS